MRTRKIVFLTAMCLTLLLFSACGLFEEEETTTPDYTYTPAMEQMGSEDEYGGVIPDEPETEGTKLDEDELNSLNKMLFVNRYGENWYYRSVPVLWSSENPADIDLYTLFYNGFVGECDNLTYDEIDYLSMQTGLEADQIREMGQFRLPESKMDMVLREYYGITLTETNMVGLNKCIYRSETNCYYVLRNDTSSVNIGLHSAYEQADGGFIIYYSGNEKNPAPQYVMCLEPNDFGSYTITMNKPVG
ncbi:MAG: hypothetical protein Q4A83_06875 [Bacillota bacterium]|nr:hypothetical protein [Bacillota bacterium]